jgi:hypothetical protein
MSSIADAIVKSDTKEFVRITPEMAARYKRDHTYRLQRAMDHENISGMRRAMGRGEFPINTTLLFCTSLDTMRKDMVEGWHRCTTAEDFSHTFVANIQHIVVRTEAEKEAIWMFIDGGGKRRTGSDFRALLAEEAKGISSTNMRAFEGGAGALIFGFSAHYLRSFRRLRMNSGERIQMVKRYLPHAHEYFAATRRAGSHAKSMHCGFAIALGVVLIEAQHDIAVPFLQSIAGNDGLCSGDPRWLFLEAIARKGAFTRDTLQTMQRLAYCWNSHFKRENRLTFNGLGEGVVVPLRGTDYQIG